MLHIAAQNGRAGVIEDLILNGADVNYGNNHENTAIHLAAQNGWNEVAGHLLRHSDTKSITLFGIIFPKEKKKSKLFTIRKLQSKISVHNTFSNF